MTKVKSILICILFSILMSACLSEQAACIQDLNEETDDGFACTMALLYNAEQNSQEVERHAEAEANLPIAQALCLDYILQLEKCGKKSDVMRELPF